jgi:hypothetical protein
MDTTNQQSKIKELLLAGQEAVHHLDAVAAVTIATELHKSLTGGASSSVPPQIVEQCRGVYIQLLFLQLHGLASERVLSLVKDNLSEAVAIEGYDLAEKILDHMDFIQIPEERLTFAENLLRALEGSSSEIGLNYLVVMGREVAPTIGNWIKDYKEFPSPVADRSSIEELNYIDHSPNPKRLDSRLQKQLLMILGLYDELRTAITETRQLPDVENDDAALDAYQWLPELPGIVVDMQSELDSATEPVHKAAPVVPTVSVPAPARPAPPVRPAPPTTPRKTVTFQDVTKHTDSLRRPRPATIPVPLRPPLRVKPAVPAENTIDQKLEELKRRTNSRRP